MIRVYMVKNSELIATDIGSQKELDGLFREVERLWVDCCNLNDAETVIVSKLVAVKKEALSEIFSGKIHPGYEKCFDEECPYYTLISTPVIEFAGELKLHPLSIILKERVLITLRNDYSSKLVESVVRAFRALRPEERKASIIMARLLAETIDENSRAIVLIRDVIDKIEEKALEKSGQKAITQSVFKLKRELSSIHRILWAQRDLLSDMNLGVIPRMKLAAEAKLFVIDAMDDVVRELEFVDSFDTSLDSLLRLQDLGSIHRVETNLMLLTVVLVVLTIAMILIEIDVVGILFG